MMMLSDFWLLEALLNNGCYFLKQGHYNISINNINIRVNVDIAASMWKRFPLRQGLLDGGQRDLAEVVSSGCP